MSCSGAPIFGVDGRLLAVLDVSAIDPGRSERAHALTGALTVNSARAIEERLFREHFRHDWVIAIVSPGEDSSGMLLAVDGDQRVVGANRVARRSLLLDDRGLQAGVSLWTMFKQDLELFRRKDRADIATRLVVGGSHDSHSALVTPPIQPFADSRNAANAALHARPRLDVISALAKMAPAPQAHGGLSPAAMRRVREYVHAHLGVSTDLATLAGVAGVLDPPFRARIQAVRRRDAAPLSHPEASRTRPRLVGSHGSIAVGDCVCCGVFRPKSPGASFPSGARRHARTVPVGTALAWVERLVRRVMIVVGMRLAEECYRNVRFHAR